MNRSVTNAIRFFMDELIPPVIRDNKYFMYPAFYFWFKGKNIKSFMDFKSYVYGLSEPEFAEVYRGIEILANDRKTDLNLPSVNYMIDNLDPGAKTLLDVGCGRGYWLDTVSERTDLELTGCDLYDMVELKKGKYVKGNIENLPFADNEFDIVTSHHTIEHVRDLDKALSELKRVTKKQLIIVTPCQRYYYYTLDLHINFFPTESFLTSRIGMKIYACKKIHGDWVFIGRKDLDTL